VTGPLGQAYHARAIETIRTGQRVLARNPQLAEAELPDAPVDPASWVNIHLRITQATGDPLVITLLRPVEWLAAQLAETAALDAEYPQALEEARGAGADRALTEIRSVIVADEVLRPGPGGIPALDADQTPTTPWIFLALHELAAVGPAEVVRVESCPPIEPGTGRLVTGTFSHHSGEVLDITVAGLTEPIGCTGAHPFWSEDRQEFVPAREVTSGGTLRTEAGTLRQITRSAPRPVFGGGRPGQRVPVACPSATFRHGTETTMELSDDIYAKMITIDWFRRCGCDLPDEMPFSVQRIPTSIDAVT
jgi:hypothetical protein